MTDNQFITRVITIILVVGSFHIVGIELLVMFIMAPTMKEFILMLLAPLPIALPAIGAHILISLYYLRPVRIFLKTTGAGDHPDGELLRAVRNRCINLPYFLAGLSLPAFLIGGTGGVWMMCLVLGWPGQVVIYGTLGGIIAFLLTIPMAQLPAEWAVGGVLEQTMKFDTGSSEKSGGAGLRIPLGVKFTVIIVVMVIGMTGYAAIVSYGLADTAIRNMQGIEKMLPTETAASLAGESTGTADTRIKSSRYYQSRLGNLHLFFLVAIVGGALLTLVLSMAAADAITRPLTLFMQAAEEIKESGYKKTINILSNDEFAELSLSFNRMTETLLSQLQQNQSLIKSIRDAVDTLQPMSLELVTIADQQKSAGTAQADATETAESTGRTIAEAAGRMASNTALANRNSEQNRRIIKEGRDGLRQTESTFEEIADKMKHLVASVTHLEQQSRKINEIVETIKRISDKTNLLSLNASVEAIKAGEEGRGFGIIAQEIRRLAHDANQSAKKIMGNIERIRESLAVSLSFAKTGEQSVISGQAVMCQMIDKFQEISLANTRIAGDLEEIDAMTSRQAASNQQLSRIISQMKLTAGENSVSSTRSHDTLRKLKQLITSLSAHTRDDLHDQDGKTVSPGTA